jgi:hypothetical protein
VMSWFGLHKRLDWAQSTEMIERSETRSCEVAHSM